MSTTFDLEEFQRLRRESATESLHSVTSEELQGLAEKLFADFPTHPWHDPFLQFIKEHKDDPTFAGKTADGYEFVYCPRANRGIWYRFSKNLEGFGIISDQKLALLAELVAGMTKRA